MTKKLKLEYTPDYEFLLLGIVSYERDYRIGWEINEKLSLDFKRVDDHKVKHKKSGQDQEFSCFSYIDENTYLEFKLLSNRSDSGYLLEELKNIDYILVVSGEYYTELAKELKEKLMNLDSVQNCFVFEPEKIRDCEKVL